MTTTRTKATLALACFAGLSAAFAAEYVGPDVPSVSTGEPIPTPTDNLRSIPRNAYETRPAIGLPVQSIFRNTRAPYYDNLRDVKLDPAELAAWTSVSRAILNLHEVITRN